MSGPTKLKVIVTPLAILTALFNVSDVAVAAVTDAFAGIPVPVAILPNSGTAVALFIGKAVPTPTLAAPFVVAVVIFISKSDLAPTVTL